MSEIYHYQVNIASLFTCIGGENIQCYTSSSGARYVSCVYRGDDYTFSFACRESVEHFIFTINSKYRIVSYQMDQIMTELAKLLDNPTYIIPQNEQAKLYENITGIK